MNKMLDINKLKLAELRMMEKEKIGIHNYGNAFLLVDEANNSYINPIGLDDDLPVYEQDRHYYTYDENFEPIRPKVRPVIENGEEDCPCYVICACQGELKKYFKKSQISLEELEKYIIDSKEFFIDVESAAQDLYPNNLMKQMWSIKGWKKDLKEMEEAYASKGFEFKK